MPPLFFNIELVFLFLNPRELVFFNPMMHEHGDFGQIPVSDTSISKTPLKSVPNKCPFFFLKKIWVHHKHGCDTPNLPDTKKLKK